MAPPRMPTFHQLVQEMVRGARIPSFLNTLNLGGSSGPGGGTPATPGPGGATGQLAQSQVTFDTTQDATYQGQSSLVDNLNRMRAESYERAWWAW